MKYFVIFLLTLMGIIAGLPAYAQCIYDPTNPHESCDDTQLLVEQYTQVEILPDEYIYYGEKFTIHAWLSDYEKKPTDSGFFVDVLDQQNNQIDSTLWFAKEDFLYLFDTIHPSYNVIPDETYTIRIEKSESMQRTGIFSDMLEFEIKKRFDVLPPLKQFRIGVLPNEIICKDSLVLIQKHNNLPACVTESTKQKLIERGWTTNEMSEIEPKITSRYEKYLDENNELKFNLRYDKNGIIIDDLQRIYDWCDYPGEKPDWYFDWNNQTHHINSENCEWMEKEN